MQQLTINILELTVLKTQLKDLKSKSPLDIKAYLEIKNKIKRYETH